MAVNFNWTCEHCNKPQVATDQNFTCNDWFSFIRGAAEGQVGLRTHTLVCLNQECRKISLSAFLRPWDFKNGNAAFTGEPLHEWKLLPESTAKPQPTYIPEPLRQDYIEACRIRDLSPKASATLARRCLQGMIRNFAGISRKTLDAEIRELTALVDQDKAPRGVTPESVEGIDHVRKIGNIGAHMESDINLIVDIDPEEAQILIGLIETLFDEWYIARHEREERFKKIAALRAEKDEARKVPPEAR